MDDTEVDRLEREWQQKLREVNDDPDLTFTLTEDQRARLRAQSADELPWVTNMIRMIEVATPAKEGPDPMDSTDLLTVLNDLEPVDLGRLEFAVITVADWPFDRGEVLALDRETGREPFGEGRKPAKWPVEWETFDRLEDALACRARVLGKED